MWTTDEVEQAMIGMDQFPATLQIFMDLYTNNRELFFQLACVGVSTTAPKWMREAAIMAAYLQALALSFEVQGNGNTGIVSSDVDSVPPLPFAEVDVETVRTFMRSLAGFPTSPDPPERPDERLAGREVSEVQVAYLFGPPGTDDVWQERPNVYLDRRKKLSF